MPPNEKTYHPPSTKLSFHRKQTWLDQASKFNTRNTETGEHIKQHRKDAISKIQAVQNSTGQTTHFPQQIKYKGEKRELNKEPTD